MTVPHLFYGFPDGTFHFLRDIAANNTKDWFVRHQAGYEQYYLAPAIAFVESLGPRLQEISRSVQFEARVNGSIFRIQRDLRFARDRTPYKTHLDILFWERERRGWDIPSFFFRMTADRLILGAGMHRFEKWSSDAYRQAVIDPVEGPALVDVLEGVRQRGPYEIGGASRRTVPRGFDPEHKRATLLFHEGLWASLEENIPSEAHSHKFIEYCAAHFQAVWPVNQWLSRVLSIGSASA